MLKRLCNALVPVFAIYLLNVPAGAQQYPSRSVRIVAPLPAGTSTDTVARVLAQQLTQTLGQQVLVDNKPGGDGVIAAGEVQRAAPDGHTLLMGTNSPLAAVPTMRKSPPYDPVTDFTPITYLGKFTHFLVVHPSVPANTLGEFVNFARANPGKLNYGTGNTFGIISIAQLMKIARISIVHVPYKGDPAALIDLISGRVQFMFATQSTSIGFVKEGKVRVLAVTNTKRTPLWPDAPTLAEAGFPNFPHLSWATLVGPAKMRRDIVDRLNGDLTAMVSRQEIREELSRQAFEPATSTPEELTAFLKEQQQIWGRTVRELGLQTD